jgi:ABC-type spermidine/putrescine transport system permease subunit I
LALDQPIPAGRARRARALRPARFDPFVLFWALPLFVWQAVFFLAPFVVLILMSFWIVRDYRLTHVYTTANWSHLLHGDLLGSVYTRTFIYATVISIVVTLAAFPLAYGLAYKVSASGRRLALLLLVTPFFTSYLLRSYSWELIFAREGLLNKGLHALGSGGIHMLGTPFATGVGYATYSFPLVTLLLLLSLVNVDRDLVEAANNLGAGRVRSILWVVIPSAKIGFVFGISFAFILAFGDFIAPTILGSSNGVTLSILLNEQIKSGADFPSAAAIALIMVATLVFVVFATFRLAFPPKKDA